MPAAVAKPIKPKSFVIARFVARRSTRGAVIWGLVFGIAVASKAIGFSKAYTTVEARAKIAASFSNNVGLDMLLGKPNHIDTVRGYTVWNTIATMTIIGAIWALLLATRSLRGEEESGRWEVLLAGRNTARQATANVLAGLAASLVLLYAIAAVCFIAVGRYNTVSFGAQAGLFFGLAAIAGAAEFMAVGAFASQLMPTRSRAATLAAGIFGVSFFIRAAADTSSAHWLLYISPLGWIEKLQPLYDSQPQWLIPIGVFIAILVGLTLYLAGRRDLGDSTFADKDATKPHLRLLNTPLGLAIRLTRISTISWLTGIGLLALFYGFLTKAAAQAFSDSLKGEKYFSRLVHSNQHAGAVLYLGFVFFFIMVIMMTYTANSVGAMREDEAEGYLDNLFVAPISRVRWLTGRIGLSLAVIVVAGLLAGFATWLGVLTQQAGISLHTLLVAGINSVAPAIFSLGLGVFAFGIVPRFTTFAVYGIIAWSFLMQILSSGLKLNHWFLDTSVFTHVTFAPATNPNWSSAACLAVIGVILALIGMAVFRVRDLQNA